MLRVVRVAGSSMAPTLRPADLLLTAAVGRAGVRRGDVVVLRHAGIRMVKRVVAVAGDRVELEAGRLRVAGARDDGAAGRGAAVGGAAVRGAAVRAWHVPPGAVFVAGDDRARSTDSRVWDRPFVALADVEGRVVRRLARRHGRPSRR